MELTSPSSFLSAAKKPSEDFCIRAGQDGLFFGLGFLHSILKTPNDIPSPVIAYLQEGDCIFKGQICIKIDLTGTDFKKEDLISVVSYLSGAYTLLSCFTERNFDFSVMVNPTPDCSFSKWEEKACLKAGCNIQKPPANICFHPEVIEKALKKGEKQIVLSNSKMSNEDIKHILKGFPPFVTACMVGDFSPSDLEDFSGFHHLKAVWPTCLQGFFPLLKMDSINA